MNKENNNKKYTMTLKGAAKEKKFNYGSWVNTSHVSPCNDEVERGWESWKVTLEEVQGTRPKVNRIELYDSKVYLEEKINLGENELTISFDDGDFYYENDRTLVIGGNMEIEKGSSSHSATAVANNSNNS